MAATPSIKVTKSFTYLGVTRLWSNRYHFNGGIPADSAHWTTLSDAITAAEKLIHQPTIHIVGTTGYAAGSEVPVFTKTYSLAGTFASGSNPMAPGDAAALVRYSTTFRTAKNHPVYLFNYYHGVMTDGISTPDNLMVTQRTAMGTYASAWISGFSDGTTSYVRAGPNGATAVGSLVDTMLTHRDFPR